MLYKPPSVETLDPIEALTGSPTSRSANSSARTLLVNGISCSHWHVYYLSHAMRQPPLQLVSIIASNLSGQHRPLNHGLLPDSNKSVTRFECTSRPYQGDGISSGDTYYNHRADTSIDYGYDAKVSDYYTRRHTNPLSLQPANHQPNADVLSHWPLLQNSIGIWFSVRTPTLCQPFPSLIASQRAITFSLPICYSALPFVLLFEGTTLLSGLPCSTRR